MASVVGPECDYLYKLLLVGDHDVGKSCLLLRFADNTYTESYISTIGVDFKVRTILLWQKTVKLQIWDNAGQERFRTITSSYYRGAHGIILIFSIFSIVSFENIQKWIEEVERYASPGVSIILVGHCYDHLSEGGCNPTERTVSEEEAQTTANHHQFPYIECCVKNATNIEKLFYTLAENIFNRQEARVVDIKD